MKTGPFFGGETFSIVFFAISMIFLKLIFTDRLEMFEDELMLDDFDDTSSSSFGGINFAPSAAHLRFFSSFHRSMPWNSVDFHLIYCYTTYCLALSTGLPKKRRPFLKNQKYSCSREVK